MKISLMPSIFTLCQKSNQAVRMEGLHGIGKSQVVETWGQENNVHIETLFLSQMEQGDLIGIPYNEKGEAIEDYDGTQQVMYWSKPSWLVRFEKAHQEGKHCGLFLDELARAMPDVRQSSLQIVLEGKIHEHHLPRLNGIKTIVIAADNPSSLYDTDDLDPALLDRFATFNVDIDVNGWLQWARAHEVEPVITDFIAEYPDKLHHMNKVDKGATPRGYVGVSDMLKNLTPDVEPLLLELLGSKVGETIGASLLHFYRNYTKVIKVEDVVKMIDDELDPSDNINEQNVQERIANAIKPVTSEIENISAGELAEKFKAIIEKGGDIDYNQYFMIYLGSLNGEIMSGIMKGWKSNDSAKFFEFNNKVPLQYLTARMIAARDNN